MTCAPSATVSMPLPVVVPTDSSPVVEKLEPVPDTRAVAPCAIEPMVAGLKLATPPSRTENWTVRWSSTPPGAGQFDPAQIGTASGRGRGSQYVVFSVECGSL